MADPEAGADERVAYPVGFLVEVAHCRAHGEGTVLAADGDELLVRLEEEPDPPHWLPITSVVGARKPRWMSRAEERAARRVLSNRSAAQRRGESLPAPITAQSSNPRRAEALTVTLTGVSAELVTVVATIAPAASPSFTFLGLHEGSIRDTRIRVLTALSHVGQWLDECRVEVRLSPPGVRNEGIMDLAIASVVLMAVEGTSLPKTVLLGELSYTSSAVRGVRGVLPALLGVSDVPAAIVPMRNEGEAQLTPNLRIHLVATMHDIVAYLRGTAPLPLASASSRVVDSGAYDMSQIQGRRAGRRATEVAAAGLHPLLLIGSPGAGRTALACRIASIMPELTAEEVTEVNSLHSIAGSFLKSGEPLMHRPLRMPHHSIKTERLAGGGRPPSPGEVGLAHRGVLFLDDMQAFKRKLLAPLDHVLGAGQVVCEEGPVPVTFPARPLLVAGILPCPCGFRGQKNRHCGCSPEEMTSYQTRLRGPVFARLEVMAHLDADDAGGPKGEASAPIRVRVVRARGMQQGRVERGEVTAETNSELSAEDLDRVARPDEPGQRELRRAAADLALSEEACARVRRIARTIADLRGRDAIASIDVEEAVSMTTAGGGGQIFRRTRGA